MYEIDRENLNYPVIFFVICRIKQNISTKAPKTKHKYWDSLQKACDLLQRELQPSLPGLPLGHVDKVRLECQRRKRLLEPAIRERNLHNKAKNQT